MTREEALLKALNPAAGAESLERILLFTGWPVEETLEVLCRLVEAGRVSFFSMNCSLGSRRFFTVTEGVKGHELRRAQIGAGEPLHGLELALCRLDRAGERQHAAARERAPRRVNRAGARGAGGGGRSLGLRKGRGS